MIVNAKRITLIVMMLLIITTIFSTSAHSSSVKTPFSVNPIMPENQNEDVNNYFDVAVEGKFKESLELMIKNESDEQKAIEVLPVNAYTSPNGIIQYKQSETDNSKLLNDKHKFTEYASEGGTYNLNPGEEKKVSIDVDVENYEGMLMGGVLINPIDELEDDDTVEDGFSIDTKVNFVVAAILTFNDVETTKDSLEFDEPYVDPMPSYYAIRLPTSHLDAKAKSFNIEYEVSHDDEVLFANEREFTFSPMSKTDIPFPWESDEITRGDTYKLTGLFEYEEGGEKNIIPFEKTFKYEKENTKVSNKRNLIVPIENFKNSYWWLLLIIPIGLIILLLNQRKYVLFSNEEALEEIYKGDELYEKVQKGLLSKNEENFNYKHIYKKKHNGDNNTDYYVLVKSIENKDN